MSHALYYKPVNKKGTPVGDRQIREILLSSYEFRPRILDENDLGFLSGLQAAGVLGAKELVLAIEKFGTIKIWEAS